MWTAVNYTGGAIRCLGVIRNSAGTGLTFFIKDWGPGDPFASAAFNIAATVSWNGFSYAATVIE